DRPRRHFQPHELGVRRRPEATPPENPIHVQPPLLRHDRGRRDGPPGDRGLKAANVAGAVIGILAGAVVLAGFIGLGLVLDSRVESEVPVVVLTLAGAYAAWLVGVIV